MMIGDEREKVIGNIRQAAEHGDFYAKVELGDPVLTKEQSKAITDRFLKNRKKPLYRMKTYLGCKVADIAMAAINRDTEIVGREKLEGLSGGAIITSNHFSPLENTVVRFLVKKTLKKKLSIISQVTNFAMGGPLGFLMNYANTIPLSGDAWYMTHDLMDVLAERVKDGVVLIYPEQEMWFNYRKPRPPKRGAYYFAAKLGVPVISCFVEIRELPEKEREDLYKTRYRIHVLDVLQGDPALSVKANSQALCDRDYALKKAAYEKIYGKPLDYTFEPEDIAGWICEKDTVLP